jgi:hypothetical protein
MDVGLFLSVTNSERLSQWGQGFFLLKNCDYFLIYIIAYVGSFLENKIDLMVMDRDENGSDPSG